MNYQQPPGQRTRDEEKRAEATERREGKGRHGRRVHVVQRGAVALGCNSLYSLQRNPFTPSCNYGALFPLLIHPNVCLYLFLLTIRACTYRWTHTHHKATLLCNKSLITGSRCCSFRLCCVLAVGAVFLCSVLLALCRGNTTWSLLHPTTLGHSKVNIRECKLLFSWFFSLSYCVMGAVYFTKQGPGGNYMSYEF